MASAAANRTARNSHSSGTGARAGHVRMALLVASSSATPAPTRAIIMTASTQYPSANIISATHRLLINPLSHCEYLEPLIKAIHGDRIDAKRFCNNSHRLLEIYADNK